MSHNLEDIDKLYSPSQWSKRFSPDIICEKHVEFTGKNSKEIQKQVKCQLNIPYGEGKREVFDIFGTDLERGAPILIYIHGGYWQEESIRHDNNSFIAEHLHKNNIKSIFIGYELCPAVTVAQISKNIEKALMKCIEYAKNNDSRGLYLAGHSAGAQLVAALYQTFIPALNEFRSAFKSAFLLGGIYDLLPLLNTKYNEPLKLDRSSALSASPLYQALSSEGYFYVVTAEHDSPAFVEQGHKMYTHLLSLGLRANYVHIKDVDHFDLVEKLAEEEYELTKLIVNTINNIQ